MPIRLGTKEGRVIVQPDFIEEMKKIREAQREKILDKARECQRALRRADLSSWYRAAEERKIKTLRAAYARLQDTQADLRSGRHGLDYEISKLRKLPYKRLLIKRHENALGNKIVYLIGETHGFTNTIGPENFKGEVISSDYRGYFGKTYEHGPYFICVDTSCIGSSELIWHIIPRSDPKASARHMHVQVNSYERSTNPLNFIQNTCWGSFNGIIQNLCMDGDIPEMFLLLHRFAGTLVLNDALTPLRNLVRDGTLKEVR